MNSLQFGAFPSGSLPEAQFVETNPVTKELGPNVVPRTWFEENRHNNVVQRGTNNAVERGTTSVVESGTEGKNPVVLVEQVRRATSAHMSPREKLLRIYDSVLVVDNVLKAREVVTMLTTKYRNLVHACDTEVANMDVKLETPVAHGDIIC